MKKYLCVIVLLMTLSLHLSAQTKHIAVSGRVMEDTQMPAISANVQLLSLPDSAYAAGIATSVKGYFTLPKVAPGRYVLKVSYIGFKTKYVPLHLVATDQQKRVGTLTLETDAVMLAEAVVTAEVAQVQVVEDTVAFNSAAFRTPQGAMLEELVKKLPGAEIDDDGNVKINGKEVTKIMVDGKEFFGGDVKTGLKNLPVDMIDKLKTYDKKSDLARITGIDDGEEETVLDLTVKKGMNQGVFGNIDLAGGTEHRYSGQAMINYFRDQTQLSFIAGANNVNDQRFSGGGGGPRWRRNSGLTATKELGLNFAHKNDKIEMGGSVRYNYRGTDALSDGYSENFLTGGATSSFNNRISQSYGRNDNVNADFRLEWTPDTLTNIIFRPNFSWGKSKSNSFTNSATFNSDPFAVVANPNDYLDLNHLPTPDVAALAQADLTAIDSDVIDDVFVATRTATPTDPLSAIRVNTANSLSASDSKSLSTNATLQVNRKLNSRGRNLTFRGRFGYDDAESDSYSWSDTRYFQAGTDGTITPEQYIRRYMNTPTKKYEYQAQMTYSEPLWKATFLQLSYRFKYNYSESDKKTYNLATDWTLDSPLAPDYEEGYDANNSKYAEYKTYTHRITTGLKFIRAKYQLNLGVDFEPQNTKLAYKFQGIDTVTTRNVFNFAPNLEFRMKFSKTSNMRISYRGRSSQPSMENLLDVTDDSDPLNIRKGNPGLKPAFSHTLRFFYNTYDAEHQRGIFTHASAQLTQNSISSVRTYNQTTGGWTTQPENINGNWNAFGMFGINSALKNKKFTIGSFSRVNYANNVEYQSVNQINEKNTTTNLSFGERLSGTFRNDWFEFGLNGSFDYSIERNKLNPDNNQSPYTYSYGATTTLTSPWNMSLSTNIANQSRRGYSDASMNRNELIWNAQLSQTFLKGNATISFEMYDILKQQSNIMRSLTASGRSVYTYNGVNSYCMLHFIYRLNIFGSKEARERMKNMGGGFGGFGGPGPRRGPGGFGGHRR